MQGQDGSVSFRNDDLNIDRRGICRNLGGRRGRVITEDRCTAVIYHLGHSTCLVSEGAVVVHVDAGNGQFFGDLFGQGEVDAAADGELIGHYFVEEYVGGFESDVTGGGMAIPLDRGIGPGDGHLLVRGCDRHGDVGHGVDVVRLPAFKQVGRGVL